MLIEHFPCSAFVLYVHITQEGGHDLDIHGSLMASSRSAGALHSGLTVSQARDLDRAQRMAMAAITGRWEPSHSGQLLQLGLEPLQLRREKICRSFAERTVKDSRHKDLFQETGFLPRKGKLTKVYRAPVSRTVAHFKSALPYLTRILNSV